MDDVDFRSFPCALPFHFRCVTVTSMIALEDVGKAPLHFYVLRLMMRGERMRDGGWMVVGNGGWRAGIGQGMGEIWVKQKVKTSKIDQAIGGHSWHQSGSLGA